MLFSIRIHFWLQFSLNSTVSALDPTSPPSPSSRAAFLNSSLESSFPVTLVSFTATLLYNSVVYIRSVVDASRFIGLVAIGRQTLAHFRFARFTTCNSGLETLPLLPAPLGPFGGLWFPSFRAYCRLLFGWLTRNSPINYPTHPVQSSDSYLDISIPIHHFHCLRALSSLYMWKIKM